MKTRHRNSGQRRGSVLVTVLIISMSLTVLVAGLLSYSLTERRINLRHALRLEARNAAEAVAEYGFAQLAHKFKNRATIDLNALRPGSPDELTVPPTSHFSDRVVPGSFEVIGGTVPPMAYRYIDPNDPANQFDSLKGKVVLARDINVFAQATVTGATGGPPITVYVGQQLSVRDAPLFAHAIFYNLDLEIFPGPLMNITGPVHTNGSLYVSQQGGNSLNFKGITTVAGHVFHAWMNGVAGNNNSETLGDAAVTFLTRTGTQVAMKNGSVWKDSKMGTGVISPDFRSYASNTWHGNLQTSVHGVTNYEPVAFPKYQADNPATPAYDPVNSGHTLIERPLLTTDPNYVAEKEAQKIASKACLYISVSSTGTITAKKRDGSAVTIPSDLVVYTANKFTDRRRGVAIDIADLNVGKLKQLIESPHASNNSLRIQNFTPDTEWNGIVYVDFTSSATNLNNSGVRLYNGRVGASGQGIPSRGTSPGFTLATNNALYVKGDFNADGSTSTASATTPETNEKPVALFGDSVTILSNNWNDSVTGSKPAATRTEVSAAIVTGLRPTDAANNNVSSGGAHNLPRFLEGWSGIDLYIRGSLVCLYEAQVDLSTWSTSYYDPPNRNWGFNTLFASGTYPPGTPLVRVPRRLDFKDMTAAEYAAAVDALPW